MAELSAASVERSARDYLAARTALARDGGSTGRARSDRAFGRLHRQMVSRLGRAIGGGRFHGALDDAEQAVAIGLVKALDSYDPARARFVTHATWAIRAELKTLGWQLHVDQRPCNRDRGVRTVSGNARAGLDDDGAELFEQLADPSAEAALERPVADRLAGRALDGLIDAQARRETRRHEQEWARRNVPADKLAARRAELAGRQRRDAAIMRAHVVHDADPAALASQLGVTRAAVKSIIDEYFADGAILRSPLLPDADVFSRSARVRAA